MTHRNGDEELLGHLIDPNDDKAHADGADLACQVAAESVRIEIVGLPGAQAPSLMARQPLMQSYGPDEIPFLCLAGVREYHDHPGHSGDAWELHRASGAGRLVRLLDIVDRFGIRPLSGYNVALEPKIVGFVQNEIPS